MSRRSRLVGRPAPRSRRGIDAINSGDGGGGLLSCRHSAAIGGPTRFATGRTTTTIRSRPAIRTRTSSPDLTCTDAFAAVPFTRT